MSPAKTSFGLSVVLNLSLLLVLACPAAHADVTLPAVISDNMVLQQGAELPIWGWAEPGERVEIRFGNQAGSYATVAGDDGRWMVQARPLESGRSLKMTIKGNNKIEISNIMVGEVWVCSGQSNMQWSVQRADNPEQEIAAADYPHIRLFGVQRN
ncbi:MAG: sialate O-acetylesterase, partial [Planctomycetota bacterium]